MSAVARGKSMKGVCTRWAVVHKHDGMPVEGTLYTHKAKANQRHYGCANPDKFEVVQLAVMPLELAHRIINAIPDNQRTTEQDEPLKKIKP